MIQEAPGFHVFMEPHWQRRRIQHMSFLFSKVGGVGLRSDENSQTTRSRPQ
jgi:hypothetical protein